jgi:protein SCO1/2
VSRLRIAVAALVTVLVASVSGVLYFTGILDSESTRNDSASQPALYTPLSPPTRGGPFSLVDHTGRAVTDKDYRGRFMLVFFGYTYCPDICPTELQTMSEAMDALGEAGGKVQPIFISVDPERDTPEVLADYVDVFHPRLVGLTGTPEQVAAAAKVYHAAYMKVPLPSAEPSAEGGEASAEGGDSDDYGMAHSVTTYLVGPDGRVLASYPRGTRSKDMAEDIRQFLDAAP